ncbi:MAG: GNAT family N-acetyltransferase [Parcubacteria group bacterium]|nr:GNAT family N-acetyltransferase [Parcubacteria group bacterium]
MFKITQLKQAAPQALKEINNLISKLSLSRIPPKKLTRDLFKKMLDQKDFFLFAATAPSGVDNRIVGTLSIYFVRIPTGLIAVAEDLIVEEIYRRWGVGRLLMEKGITLARSRRARHISLRTNPKRAEANRLYRSLGFKQMAANFYRINLF